MAGTGWQFHKLGSSPQNVGQIHIHTANIGAGYRMGVVLRAAGYPVVRSYALTMWTPPVLMITDGPA